MVSSTAPPVYRTSGWVYFAGAMSLLLAVFNITYAIAALVNDEWVVFTENRILLLDLTALGWTFLVIGVIQLVVGFGIMAGALWARVIAVAGAFLSAVASMAWLSVYPVWSLVILALDVLVIYGLVAHGDEVAT